MDKGHMVIKGFGKGLLNSIWSLYITANRLSKKRGNRRGGIRILYNVRE